uniref:Glyco_transf_8 n=1 Tax=uncultured Erwinia sp. TaxID=246798 RepID=A0A060CCD3_9GAMM|nr:Glyco_transf_8 [uncultured Erwinia sp.]
MNSLTPLLNINFNGNSLAACVDGFVKNELSEYSIGLGIEKEHAYFNSGVILYNINLWLESFSIYKFNELINRKKYIFPDQDVLILCLQG